MLRLLCCPQNGERAAVYSFRNVHSAEKWVPVVVNLVNLWKIRGVIFRMLIQLSKLEKGAEKPPDLAIKRFLHPPRTCYWHRVASKEAVGAAPVSDIIKGVPVVKKSENPWNNGTTQTNVCQA